MEQNELITLAGVFFGGLLMGILGYLRKKPEALHQQDAVVAGVGLEFGSRLQTDQVIEQLKRIADALTILADRKQAGMEAKLDTILRELHDAEERDRENREREGRR